MERTKWKVPKDKSEGFLMVDKRMIRLFGSKNAIFMCNLLDKYFYWKNHSSKFSGWFFLIHREQTEQTGLSRYQLMKCKQEAVLNRWIRTRYMGTPAKEWYEINLESPDIQIAIQFLDSKSSSFSPPIIKSNNNLLRMEVDEDDSFLDEFNQVWEIFPKKVKRKQALIEFNKIMNKPRHPNYREIIRAIIKQKKSEQWQSKQFIPLLNNWLANEGWNNDPSQMIDYSKKRENKPPIYDDGIKYIWNPDKQLYEHCVTGERYIP